jgi:hypothetical protein
MKPSLCLKTELKPMIGFLPEMIVFRFLLLKIVEIRSKKSFLDETRSSIFSVPSEIDFQLNFLNLVRQV